MESQLDMYIEQVKKIKKDTDDKKALSYIIYHAMMIKDEFNRVTE